MALWLVRTGQHGEFGQHFLDTNRIYLCWRDLANDLSKLNNRDALAAILADIQPDARPGRIQHHSRQIWAFSRKMKPGDWVVVPDKHKPAVHVAEITGDCTFDAAAENPLYHYRDVKWVAQDIPRSNFDQDLLYSFGAFMTICQIKRNDAESRIRAMAKNNWVAQRLDTRNAMKSDDEDSTEADTTDIELVARDQIARQVVATYMGHGMARLVEAILRAQGYTTYLSPPGPDKGIDILASAGPMGFGNPRICVQVKSGNQPLDRPTLDQLRGAMQTVRAEHGLLVSWAGFKSTIDRETAVQFFHVRLWDQDNLIDHILQHYDDLDDDIRNELPLKRIWTLGANIEDK